MSRAQYVVIWLIHVLLVQSVDLLGFSFHADLLQAGQTCGSDPKNTLPPNFLIHNLHLRGGREIQDIKYTSVESSAEDNTDKTDGRQYMKYTILNPLFCYRLSQIHVSHRAEFIPCRADLLGTCN